MNAVSKIEPATLAASMAAAFAEIGAAIKAKENAAFKNGGKVSKYADLASVIDAIKPALVEHGLFFTQHPIPTQGAVEVETVLRHAGGEVMSLGTVSVPVNQSNAHAYGSALSYARRYGLVTAFGVPTEDDDGNAAVAGGQGKREVSPPQPAFITDAQLGELQQLLDHLNVPVAEVLKVGKINSLRDLGADRFDKVRAWINSRALELRNAKPSLAEEIGDDIKF